MSYPLVLTNVFTYATVGEVMVCPDMSVMDVCRLASVVCSGDTTAKDVVLQRKDGSVLEGEIQLKDLDLDKGGSVNCVKMTPVNARAARQHAKLRRLLATSLEQFLPVMPKNLSQEPFGEELAAGAALAIKAGESANGRIKFDYRVGVMSFSTEDMWTLRVDTVLGPCCDSKEEVDGLAIVWRIGVDEVTSWETVENFVQFWASMSEQKIAAIMAGFNTAPDKATYVTGTVTRAQLKQLAKSAPVGELVLAQAPAQAPAAAPQSDLDMVREVQAHEDAFCLGSTKEVVGEADLSFANSSAARAAAVHVDESKPMFEIRVWFDDDSRMVVRLNDYHTVGDLRCLCSNSEAMELKARKPGALPLADDSMSLRAAELLNANVIARPQRM